MKAETLLRGSRYLDAVYSDVRAVIQIAVGSLTDAEIASINGGGERIHTDKYYAWSIWSNTGRVTCKLMRREISEDRARVREEHVFTEPGFAPKRDIAFVHACLDGLIEGLEKKFPGLSHRWAYLRRADRSMEILYELVLPRHEGEDDAFVFRKESRLTFPLPLNTRLCLSVEGQNEDDAEFFRITGYEHSASDFHGDLEERGLVMIGKLENPGSRSLADYIALLKENGWRQEFP